MNIKFNLNYLKVSTKKGKWLKIKAKTIDYFKTISIPGIPQIMATENYLFKFIWTVLMIVVFAFGSQNISLAVNNNNNNNFICDRVI